MSHARRLWLGLRAVCSGAAAVLLLVSAHAHAQTDPRSSWSDGPAKKAILEFVQVTTDKANPKFVPPEARIATFDQDGTTWVERPMYTQVVYWLEQVRVLAENKPELKDVEPFQMKDAQALFTALTDAGLDTCFANPGTSEMQLVYEMGRTENVRAVLCLARAYHPQPTVLGSPS